jgi:hypothetical protein
VIEIFGEPNGFPNVTVPVSRHDFRIRDFESVPALRVGHSECLCVTDPSERLVHVTGVLVVIRDTPRTRLIAHVCVADDVRGGLHCSAGISPPGH